MCNGTSVAGSGEWFPPRACTQSNVLLVWSSTSLRCSVSRLVTCKCTRLLPSHQHNMCSSKSLRCSQPTLIRAPHRNGLGSLVVPLSEVSSPGFVHCFAATCGLDALPDRTYRVTIASQPWLDVWSPSYCNFFADSADANE